MPYRRPLFGDFDLARRQHPAWPVVVSEGDSWFSFADIIGRLDDPSGTGDPKHQRAWALLRMEKAGDEIMTILSGSQRAKLRKVLRRCPIDALLFSAGGNDIIGPDLLPLLRPWKAGMTAQNVIVRPRLTRRLRQIADCYRELLDLIADAGQQTRVFTHSYDYAIPANKPVKILFGKVKVAGPWMHPYFEERGVPDATRLQVIEHLIDAFAATVDQVAAEASAGGRLVRVETRGVVRDDWKDEIHPNRKAAIRVAKTFEAALVQAGIITEHRDDV